MKKNLILLAFTFCGIAMIASCGDTKKDGESTIASSATSSDESEHAGTFVADGKNFKGRSSTQDFPATKEFSVLCQDDTDPNNSTLMQLVFKDEASARTPGTFKIVHTSYSGGKAANEVSVSFDNVYESDEQGTLTVTKSGGTNTVTFNDVEVKTISKEKKTVAGKIEY